MAEPLRTELLLSISVGDLSLQPGETLVILGGAGSGKSRLLRMIAGLENPGSFEIRLAPGIRLGSGLELVSSEWASFSPRKSARVHLLRSLRKLGRRERPSIEEQKARVSRVLELLELENLADRPLSTFSTSERSRVALGCALVRQPVILLADDPGLGLDAGLRTRLRWGVSRWLRESGGAAIFATQDEREAFAFGARTALLDRGLIRQVGSVEELYRDPTDRHVGESFGMLFLEGRLDTREGERLFAFADGDAEGVFPLSFVHDVPEVPEAESGRGSIVLGIHPRSVRVARSVEELGGFEILETALPGSHVLPGWEAPWLPTGLPPRALREEKREAALRLNGAGGALRRVARVLGVEWLGRETRLILEVGGHVWQLLTSDTDLRPGERCWFELDRQALYWFGAQGDRLRTAAIPEPAEPLPTLALEEEPGTRGLKMGNPAPSTEKDESARI